MKYGRPLLSCVLVLLILAACGPQSAAAPTPVDVEISVRVEPEALAVGETTLFITLKDGSGSPVDGAVLEVHGNMDHAGMTPVDREAGDSTNGEYRVPFEWTMGGGWIVTITAQLPNDGGEVSKTFEYFVEAASSESIINRPGGMEMGAEATAESTTNDAVTIHYAPDHDPAIGGDATVTVMLTDADGSAITDAAVEITGNMAHAGMMPISGEGEHTGNGQYIVPLRWTMAGDWQVTVKVTLADGRQFEQAFDQQVVMP